MLISLASFKIMLFCLAGILLLKIINFFLDKVYKRNLLNLSNISNYRKQLILNGSTSIGENKLINYSREDFQSFSLKFLDNVGYSDIESNKENSFFSLKCKNMNTTFMVYIHHIKFKEGNEASDLSKDILSQIWGHMLINNVSNVILLSNGGLDDSSLEYLNSIQSGGKLKIYDRTTLVKDYKKVVLDYAI